ncbi:hypothetical protein JCM10207_001056 [Rhodosporidiobolus poonsookiae]
MFALPLQSFSPTPLFEVYSPSSPFDLHTDFHAAHRHRQRQLALAQARREELAHRRRHEEEKAALAHRAALVAQAQHAEQQRRRALAHRRHAFVQRQRAEERRRLAEARRPPQTIPSFFDLVFEVVPALVNDQDDEEDAQDPPEVDLTAETSASDSDFSPSPALSASSALLDDEEIEELSLSSDSDSSLTSDAESDADSTAFTARDEALSTLSTLSTSFDARRAAFVSPASLTFSPSPSSSSSSASDRSPSPPLAFTRTNAPLLAYEDALLCLLSQIDSVESHGDAEVRRARKALVRRVEGELKRLDGVREAEWERQSGASGSENESGSEADTEEGEDQEMNSSDDEDVQGTFWSTLACFSG